MPNETKTQPDNKFGLSLEEQLNKANETIASMVENAWKPIDAHFTDEHKRMIAAKYTAKYSDAEQLEHRGTWPMYTGNQFALYVLAETLNEARKAVFSANLKDYLRDLDRAMSVYTPIVDGVVLTERQVSRNREANEDLEAIRIAIPAESERSAMLKKYAEALRSKIKTGKDADKARLVFYHVSNAMGVLPNSIW
jgi:ATP-dependent RNA circularization protein (DNA/RNA ligase family)